MAERRHNYQCCGAKKRQGEGNCTRPAGWGTDHAGSGTCKLHGGSTRSGRVVALRKEVGADAQTLLVRANLPPVTDPLTELAKIAAEVTAWKDLIGARVQEMTSIRYSTETGGEQLRAEVAVWERALDRCERFLSSMAKLAIDERLARITELQKQMMVRALEAGLAAAGVAGPAAIEAKKAAARQLRVA